MEKIVMVDMRELNDGQLTDVLFFASVEDREPYLQEMIRKLAVTQGSFMIITEKWRYLALKVSGDTSVAWVTNEPLYDVVSYSDYMDAHRK